MLGLTAAAVGAGLATGTPAAAGGIGAFLSPAFGTSCANHHGAHAAGATTAGSGSVTGNLAGLSLGSPLNQCGGADVPDEDEAIDAVGDILEADVMSRILAKATARPQ